MLFVRRASSNKSRAGTFLHQVFKGTSLSSEHKLLEIPVGASFYPQALALRRGLGSH